MFWYLFFLFLNLRILQYFVVINYALCLKSNCGVCDSLVFKIGVGHWLKVVITDIFKWNLRWRLAAHIAFGYHGWTGIVWNFEHFIDLVYGDKYLSSVYFIEFNLGLGEILNFVQPDILVLEIGKWGNLELFSITQADA